MLEAHAKLVAKYTPAPDLNRLYAKERVMVNESKSNKFGWVWIIISPILWVMSAISTVESITIYYTQLICISIIAIIGLIFGIVSLLKVNWAYVVLKYISWIIFILLSGSGVVMSAYTIPLIIKGNFGGAAMIFPIALGVVVTGLPFYYMARKWG